MDDFDNCFHVPTDFRRSRLALALSFALAGCGGDGGSSGSDAASGDDTAGDAMPLSAAEAGPVVDNYAALVHENYAVTLQRAQDLEAAIDAFVADPTEATHRAAKDAWLAAREPYGQTESFRFYDGPIDDEAGPEGRLNGWPLDEAYIDYVDDAPDAGIINDPSVAITKEMLAGLNEVGGEENIATGYHAIEFLLWGQDHSPDGPGDRSFEDFLDTGMAPNPDRRRQYLQVVAELLVEDLTYLVEAWDGASSGNFRASFVSLDPNDAVQNMMRGIGALASAELSEERMNVAYDTKLQEDEHSCFSDNTHNDLLYNFLAIKNVYFGDYGSVSGPGIDTLVEARDPELAAHLAEEFAETEALISAIPAPFDQAIVGDDSAPGRVAVAAAISALRELGDELVEGAGTMGITLNVALE